jgi:hypothetical protein
MDVLMTSQMSKSAVDFARAVACSAWMQVIHSKGVIGNGIHAL